MRSGNVQRLFMHVARSLVPDPKKWAEELSSALHKSRYSVYKKYTGETALTLDEMLTLSKKYGISFDSVISNGESSSFIPFPGSREESGPSVASTFLTMLEEVNSDPENMLTTVGYGLPLGYAACHPALFRAFERDYYYVPQTEGQSTRAAPGQVAGWAGTVERAHRLYLKTPRVEFWNEPVIRTSINELTQELIPTRASGVNEGYRAIGSNRLALTVKKVLLGNDATRHCAVHWVSSKRQCPVRFFLCSSGRSDTAFTVYLPAFGAIWLKATLNASSNPWLQHVASWKRNSVCLSSAAKDTRTAFVRRLTGEAVHWSEPAEAV